MASRSRDVGASEIPRTADARPEVLRAVISAEPIVLADHEELVDHVAAGAVVGFVGAIRNHDHGREVLRLEYSSHPTAEQVMAEVANEVAERSSGVRALAASHRVGVLHLGDAALVVAVAADHRREAFATCRDLVDTIKERLPVWKHQFFTDGTDEWVGSA